MYIFYVIRGVQAEDLYGHAWWCQCQKYLLLVEFFTHSVPGSRTYSKSVLAGSGCTHLFLEIHTGSCVSLLSLSPNEPPWCRWLSTTLMPKECADPRGTSIGSVKARSDLSCMCCLTVYYADAYMMCRSHNIYIHTKCMHILDSYKYMYKEYIYILRTYPLDFGRALAEIVPTMHEGIKGLREANVSRLQLQPCMELGAYIYIYIEDIISTAMVYACSLSCSLSLTHTLSLFLSLSLSLSPSCSHALLAHSHKRFTCFIYVILYIYIHIYNYTYIYVMCVCVC